MNNHRLVFILFSLLVWGFWHCFLISAFTIKPSLVLLCFLLQNEQGWGQTGRKTTTCRSFDARPIQPCAEQADYSVNFKWIQTIFPVCTNKTKNYLNLLE